MTLSRQLILTISLLFLLITLGSFWISIDNTRNYLKLQQQSHAQDTATSLGLALTPILAAGDEATLQSMVDAVFDRGYYQIIELQSMEDETILHRENTLTLSEVPDWFRHLLPLETQAAESVLTTGWTQAAKLTVKTHPGYAYSELWRNATQVFWLSLGSLLSAIAALSLVLHYILSPLRAIEKQAISIYNHKFTTVDKIPVIREFRSVIKSMNKMSRRMEASIQELSQYAEQMRYEAYADPLTELWNRRGFESRLTHILSTENQFGILIFIRLRNFAQFNQQQGYQAADYLLIRVALLIRIACDNYSNAITARVRGADFAILLPSASKEDGEKFANELSEVLGQLHHSVKGLERDVGHLGLASYASGVALTDLLIAADSALSKASSNGGENGWHLISSEQFIQKGQKFTNHEWQALITQACRSKSIHLQRQAIRLCKDNELLYHEFFARIYDGQGNLLPADAFIPMAERLGLIAEFDLQVIEMVLEYLEKPNNQSYKAAVNISTHSFQTDAFLNGLTQLFSKHKKAVKRLICEISEYGAQQHPDATKQLLQLIKQFKAHMAIEHFGIGFNSLEYIRELKIDYLKVDGSYIRDIAKNKDHQLFLHSLVGIAHGLDILVIAEWTETKQDWKALQQLQVDAAQGYYVSQPENHLR